MSRDTDSQSWEFPGPERSLTAQMAPEGQGPARVTSVLRKLNSLFSSYLALSAAVDIADHSFPLETPLLAPVA